MLKNRFLTMQSFLQHNGVGTAAKKPGRPAVLQQSRIAFSRPFYDTGEHVLTGEISNAAVSGILFPVNGVDFTYGEIITMGDFFETADQFLAAPASQLNALRSLIRKSRDFYERKIMQAKNEKEPSIDWSSVIPKYYELAEKNDAHFSPYEASVYSGFSHTKGLDDYYKSFETKQTNRGEWEKYHTRALAAARTATTPDQKNRALIINAFGDHFLTDAFSAGHLFNKGIVNRIFQDNFYNTSGKLTDQAKSFFEKVADKVLADKAAYAAFDQYEVTDQYGVDLIFGTYNPNLGTNNGVVKTLKEILIGIAERKDSKINGPDLIGNTLIAKVLHDILNQQNQGVEVTNRKKDAPWNLTGDGRLNKKNIEMIHKAVNQSVSNVATAATTKITDTDSIKNVWDYTPVPTENGLRKIRILMGDMTRPDRALLISYTADLVINNRVLLIEKLKSYGIIQKD